jgi:uncharacterized protein YeaO (DUF488 family)
MFAIKIKRVYEKVSKKNDGYRILIDRLWPRGLKKEEAHIDLWLKELAPSAELRTWFNHEPARWLEFKKHYFKELASKQVLLNVIREKARAHPITLLYGAKDETHNNAVALQEYLGKSKQ